MREIVSSIEIRIDPRELTLRVPVQTPRAFPSPLPAAGRALYQFTQDRDIVRLPGSFERALLLEAHGASNEAKGRTLMQATETIVADSVDKALAATLGMIVEQGVRVSVGGSHSIASGRTTYEILNYSVRVTNPRQRFPTNPEFCFNLVAAVCRFVWMMSGSDRLSDIGFYLPKADMFSDDGLTIPGSSYGRRIIAPRPGVNQLAGVIKRLKEDPHSRRAFLSIYHPEDATRESKDIPCVLALGYVIRDGKLFATTNMRANNAYSLFVYNFFEFSLLAEIIAGELQVELGPLTHSAVSMHVYEEELERARAIAATGTSTADPSEVIELPSSPLATIRALIELEPMARDLAIGGTMSIRNVMEEAEQRLSGAWREMFQVLMIYGLMRRGRTKDAGDLLERLGAPWRRYLSVSPDRSV